MNSRFDRVDNTTPANGGEHHRAAESPTRAETSSAAGTVAREAGVASPQPRRRSDRLRTNRPMPNATQ